MRLLHHQGKQPPTSVNARSLERWFPAAALLLVFGAFHVGAEMPSYAPHSTNAPRSDEWWAVLFGSFGSLGGEYSCAIAYPDSLWCFGSNVQQQQGPASASDYRFPSKVQSLTGVIDVATGTAHTCAILSNETLWCLGDNSEGQLGIGDTSNPNGVPTQVLNLSGVVGVAAGHRHTCAIRSDETLWCFGSNSVGQLGINSTVGGSPVPVKVQSLTGVIRVAAGRGIGPPDSHTCAIRSDQTLWCFGYNLAGQLGNNSTDDSILPVRVPGLAGVIDVAAGALHTCTILSDQTLWCFGSNVVGELGINSTVGGSLVPVKVQSLTGVIRVAAGTLHTCAILFDETLWCFGRNNDGQLGINSTVAESRVPVKVQSLTGVIGVAAGGFDTDSHTCAILSDLTMSCFGDNSEGQLGIGSSGSTSIPTRVASTFTFAIDEVVNLNTDLSYFVQGDLSITDGGVLNVNTNQLFTVDGDLSITEGGVLNVNTNQSITLKGNLSMSPNASQIVLSPYVGVTAFNVDGCATFGGALVVDVSDDIAANGTSELQLTLAEYSNVCNTFDSVEVVYDGPGCVIRIQDTYIYGPTSLDMEVLIELDDSGCTSDGDNSNDSTGDGDSSSVRLSFPRIYQDSCLPWLW